MAPPFSRCCIHHARNSFAGHALDVANESNEHTDSGTTTAAAPRIDRVVTATTSRSSCGFIFVGSFFFQAGVICSVGQGDNVTEVWRGRSLGTVGVVVRAPKRGCGKKTLRECSEEVWGQCMVPRCCGTWRRQFWSASINQCRQVVVEETQGATNNNFFSIWKRNHGHAATFSDNEGGGRTAYRLWSWRNAAMLSLYRYPSSVSNEEARPRLRPDWSSSVANFDDALDQVSDSSLSSGMSVISFVSCFSTAAS